MNDIKAIRSSFFDFTRSVADPSELEGSARFIEDGLLLLKAGKIISLQSWNEAQARLDPRLEILHLPDNIIMPGFIDSHIHYPQTEMIGADGEQLLDWLDHYTFPTESQYHCPDRSAGMASFFLDQLLRNGTTTAMVYGTVHAQSVDALFAAAFERHMRLIAGKVMMDRHAPDALLETPGQSEEATRGLIARWHNKGRLSYALTPRFAPTSSPELLAVVGRLRREFPDLYLQTHLSENTQEVAWVKALFPERVNYFDVYRHHGLTGRKSVFAHCLHLDEQEWRDLAHSRSAIAFCPTSNLFLGSGLFDLQKKWDWRIPLGIGTDVGAGTTFNLLQTLAEAYKVGQLRGYRLSVYEGLYHATLGAAHALSLDGVLGNFAPGKEADFVVLDPRATPLQRLRQANSATLRERLFLLMILGDDRTIYQTWIQGKPVYRRDDDEIKQGAA
ncbi:guanine deaminase [Acerihabitans arboris]|uniref:Guanine deaminase n=1 Tax=Acerihabitans arboris TaxID=2691583 RepID=A0A845SJK2_9GAMM|nr:guanine deaminase [Acerihabitans arboris]NDL63144.1 guanine deaminase [Acerihabitans arboris]